jgi:oxygen-independent coproporphyrinogen-3 oxidase
MDHFARPGDELCRAQDDRTLHRNFQGYTTRGGCDLLGMGVSAISGLEDVYAQNWRDLPHYYEAIDRDIWPTMRGANVSTEDKIRRSTINRLLCHCVVVKREVERDFDIDFDDYFAAELERLPELERDGLVRLGQDRIAVAPLGRIFIRNIAMVFDSYLHTPNAQRERRFSRTL